MDTAAVLQIASDWSAWDGPVERSIPRRVTLPKELRPGVALVVQGVRRCGKSTLLRQLIGRYELDRAQCLFLNFEDPRLSQDLRFQTLDLMVEAYEGERGRNATYFLDEIQWVDGWQKWLRSQLDRSRDRRFVVTGSNAHLLSGELGSTLTGRHHTVELMPFDFEEFRAARSKKATLEEYLECGGFPAAITSPDRDLLLRTCFTDIIERDVRERVAARSVLPLRRIAQMLFESAGAEFSARRAAAALGISPDTAGLYLDALEDAFLALSCPYFAWSERKRVVRSRKWYPIDTGLRRVSVTATGKDRGKALECATFLLLRRRFGTVHYWRGEREVDFVIEHRGVVRPVQVSWDEPAPRHHEAVDEFHSAHPHAGEPVHVSAKSFAAGIPELSDG